MMADGVAAQSCAAWHGRAPATKRSRPQPFGAHKKHRPNGWDGADQRALITTSDVEPNASASPSNKPTLDYDCRRVGVDVVDSVKSSAHEKFFVPPNDLWLPD